MMTLKGKGKGNGFAGKGKGATVTAIVPAEHFNNETTQQCDCCNKVNTSRDPGSNQDQSLPFVNDMSCIYCFVYWSQMFSWMDWKAEIMKFIQCVCRCVCLSVYMGESWLDFCELFARLSPNVWMSSATPAEHSEPWWWSTWQTFTSHASVTIWCCRTLHTMSTMRSTL